MSALLGDGLPALRLNEHDLAVDRKLPAAKNKSNITPQKDTKENQLKDGASFRSSKKVIIKGHMNNLQDEEYDRKMFIKKTWNTATDVVKQSYLNMISNYNLPEYKKLIEFIKQERAWWKSQYSSGLTVSVLETVFADYMDELGDRTKTYEDALKQNEVLGKDLLEQRKNAKPSKTDINTDINTGIDWNKISPEIAEEVNKIAEEKNVESDPFKRTVWDDVNDSWIIIGGMLGTLIWIVLGLRFGSSLANEYYYLKSPYKILIFVYTFIFTPVLIPYFIYKTLRTWLFPKDYPPFIYRCFLPLFESEDPSVASSWFTYLLDELTIADKAVKINLIEQSKRNVLKNTIIDELKTDLAKFTLLASTPPSTKGC